MQDGDGVDEESPPDEHLPEVVRVSRVAPQTARDESSAVLLLRPERGLLRVGDGLDREPCEPDAGSGDRPGTEAGWMVAVEQVGHREHHDRHGDRLEEPEPGKAKRLVAHSVEAMVDLHPQDPPEQVTAQPQRPGENEKRRDELYRFARAREQQDDREQREGEAVGEVGDDVRLPDGGDREERTVDRQRKGEGEEDRGHRAGGVTSPLAGAP